ncbi:MAG: hypothetical protein ACKOWP_00455 [Microbacteriaceae bacterium]
MAEESRRNTLQGRLTDAYREADKLIVSVASGVLALSVAFIGQIENPTAVWTLRLAWAALPISVACVLGSLLVEQADKRRRIHELDAGLNETDGKTDSLTNILNIAGFSSFLIGLVALACFLCLNAK